LSDKSTRTIHTFWPWFMSLTKGFSIV